MKTNIISCLGQLKQMFGIFWFLVGMSQTIFSFGQQESMMLDEVTFFRNVLEHHPGITITRQSEEQAYLYFESTKGAFDPSIMGNFAQKLYEDKLYYRHAQTNVKVPMHLLGIDFHAGYQYTDGLFVNPERALPSGGLYYVGIDIPLLQGMLTDGRRINQRIAKKDIDRTMAVTSWERNQILYESADAFWIWLISYQKMQTLEEALQNSNIRLEAVKFSAGMGDKPLIDTLEAFVQVQQIQIQLLQARMQYQFNSQLITNFIWDPILNDNKSMVPFTLNSNGSKLDAELLIAPNEHPLIRQLNEEIGINDLEIRWQKELMKPRLDFQYTKLIQSENPFPGGSSEVFQDQTLGLRLSWPIFMRQASNLGKAYGLKSEQLKQQRDLQLLNIQNRTTAGWDKVQNLRSQLTDARKNVDYFYRLLEAETEKFTAGESNVFMVNAREQQWIQSQLLVLDLEYHAKIAYYRVLADMGQLEKVILN